MKDSLFEWVQGWACKDQFETISNLRVDLDSVSRELEYAYDALDDAHAELYGVRSEYEALKDELMGEDPDRELREYWEYRRPKTNSFRYPARIAQYGGPRIQMDPRVFLNPNDNMVPKVGGDSNDDKAFGALRRVINNVRYKTDIELYGTSEHWPFSYETVTLRQGDCDGGAILMANIMLKSGVPYWRIRLNAGKVEGGGHAWVTYLRESDNQWVILDWCYWPFDSLKGLLWRDAEKYFSIWFSLNQLDIYAADVLDRK